MIRSELIADERILIHTCSGNVTILDVSKAMVVTALHSGLPIVWDLSESGLDSENREMLNLAPQFIESTWFKASDEKRAFIVKDERSRDLLEMTLGKTRAPWPWAIFYTQSDAKEWILD